MGERKERWTYPKAQNKIIQVILGVSIKALTNQGFSLLLLLLLESCSSFPVLLVFHNDLMSLSN